jgi:hypothetical protein
VTAKPVKKAIAQGKAKAEKARKPVVCSFDLDVVSLEELATAKAFACSDSSRPILQQLLIEIEGRDIIRAWATDSYRLCRIERTISNLRRGDRTYAKPASFMFPASKLAEIAKAAKAVKVEVPSRGVRPEPRTVHFDIVGNHWTVADSLGGVRWNGSLLDGTYPNVKEVVPARDKWQIVAGQGVAFDPKFLRDFVKIAPFNAGLFGANVVVRSMDTLKPVVVTSKDERTTLLLMPVRLD